MFMLLQKPRSKQTKIKDSDSPENDGRAGQDSVSEYLNKNLCPPPALPAATTLIWLTPASGDDHKVHPQRWQVAATRNINN